MISEDCAITEYADLVETLVQRRRDLKLSQWELGMRAGLHDGYSGKIESWQHPRSGRRLGPISLPAMLGALDLKILLVTADGEVLARVHGKSSYRGSMKSCWPSTDIVMGLS